MKGFFKFTFASILGVLIGLFIFVLILVGVVSSSSKEKAVVVEPNTVLLAKFDTPIVDRHPESPFEFFNPATFSPESRMGLDQILENIRKAKTDDNIEGIVLDLSLVNIQAGNLHEIREALQNFKSSGKFIYAYADIYTQGSYYLATVADKIYTPPSGKLFFTGLSAEIVFYKKALDKLGIEAQVIKYGEYKGATEIYVNEKLSKENREQIQDYLNSIWNHMLEGISETRNINVDELNDLADKIEITNAKSALKHNFVDSLIYYDEFINEIKTLTETPENKDIKTIGFKKYAKVPEKRETKGLAKEKIAVVYAEGTIISGEGDGSIGGDKYARVLRKARRDSTIKAIVFRINSGGGDALASDIIWREVKLAAEVKPVIVSMGNVAASGGYYIAAPATRILANPTTITGSIGVFAVLPNAKEFTNDKLGITSDVVRTNNHSDLGSIFQPLDTEERAMLQEEITDFYKNFLEIVAEGRAMTVEEVDKIARGHVYTGADAIKIGLIDDFGGMEKAIKIAGEEAGIDNYRIVKLPKAEDPFTKIMNDLTGGNAHLRYLEEQLGDNYFYYEELKKVQELDGLQARLPYSLRIK